MGAFLLVAGAVSGCSSIVGEERAYYMKKEWHDSHWLDTADERLGVSEVLPTAKDKEAAKEREICMHPNSSERVIEQDGVSDQLVYRHCVLAPYAVDGGSRMGNRPDGVGEVVKP